MRIAGAMNMVRKIQLIATLLAGFLGIGALFDLFVLRTGETTMLLAGLPLIPTLSRGESLALGAILTATALIAPISTLRCHQAISSENRRGLDFWRRVTWGLSNVETAGCLLFALNGSLLYLPSAIALLIAGVAELATILYEVQRRAWVASHHAA
jgi:hypothetical protein